MARRISGTESIVSRKAEPEPTDPSVIAARVANARSVARTALRPTVNCAFTIQAVRGETADDLGLVGLVEELSQECVLVSKGDLRRPEAILTVQAHTLDALFGRLTRMAFQNLDNFDAAERLYRLAFKAQSQARATIEAIGALKNPPMVFAKQANVTSGPQQVNNGFRERYAHAGNSGNAPTELLEQAHGGERLDPGSKGEASGGDSSLEAVGAVLGAKDGVG